MGINADREVHSAIYRYLQEEFDAISSSLAAGGIDSFRDKVGICRRIDGVLQTIQPYVRSDPRARMLVRRGERLKSELLSSRPYLEKRVPAALMRQLEGRQRSVSG